MKKRTIILGLILTLTMGTIVAYADNGISGMKFLGKYNDSKIESMEERLEERTELRKERINRALEDGTITESQAKEWEEHFKYMDEFHEKNGYYHGAKNCGRGDRSGHGMRGYRF